MRKLNYLERFLVEPTDKAQSFFLDVKFLIFAFGLISSLGFLTIYSFLYGYYFSGEGGSSNFSIISNLIPFSLQTLSITSIFFICIYYTISRLFSLRKNGENKWLRIIVFLVSIFLLNLCITIFFANDITFQSILSFSLIWVSVGLIVWFLYISVNSQENVFSVVKGAFFSIFLLLILFIVFTSMDLFATKIQKQEFIILSIIPLMLLFTTIFQKLYHLKWIAFISYYPFFSFSYGLILFIVDTYFYKTPYLINFFLLLVLPLVTNLLSFKHIYKKEILYITNEKAKLKKYKDKEKETLNLHGGLLYKTFVIIYKMFTSNTHFGYKVISCLLLLAVFVWTPRISLFSGQLIRILNLPYGNQVEITYVNQNDVEGNIIGNYYIELNSTLYISNSEWQLETLKPINYHIKPKEEIPTSQE